MRRQVCHSLQGTVSSWEWDLQARYGDPRVYAAQQNEMIKMEESVLHNESRKTSALLEDAYAKQREKNRIQHSTRLATSRLLNRTSDTRPESRAAAKRTRKPLPPDAQPPERP